MRGSMRCAALLLVLAGLGACFSEDPGTTGPGTEDAVVVRMTEALTFEPSHVQIRAGQTIRWENVSAGMPHTATGDPALAQNAANVRLPAGVPVWNSGIVSPGGAFERRFDVVGSYTYFCDPHEPALMVGTIEVIP